MAFVIWLRTETKDNEERTALVPADAKKLLDSGCSINVEEDPNRIFPIDEYETVGCNIVAAHSWKEAPPEDFVLGLKELTEESFPLKQKHIFFAHAYKGQEGAKELLDRFKIGAGKLFDLEYLVDENKRRIAAFGKWAGYVGAAVGVNSYCHLKNNGNSNYPPLKSYKNKELLLEELKEKVNKLSVKPQTIIIGALGRCGSGALELLNALALSATKWDFEETKKGGPFKEIADHDIFINTVLMTKKVPPFIDKNVINDGSNLSIISDVSCDPNSDLNPIPIYNQGTDWSNPLRTVNVNNKKIDILAVDNLPSVLPKESSEDFSSQLISHLLDLAKEKELPPVWQNSLDTFNDSIN